MKIFLFIATLCLLLADARAQAAPVPDFDIKAHCKEVASFAGGSAQIELQCRKMEEDAKQTISSYEAPEKAIKACLEVAKVSPSYTIFFECLKMENAALKELE